MVKHLVSRAEFARLAGVSAAAVTKACNNSLRAAVSGKRVDLAHPDVQNYLDAKSAPSSTGLDNRYEEAVEICHRDKRYSITYLQRTMKIGYERAKSIIGVMRSTGQIPNGDQEVVVTSSPEPAAKKVVHIRGTEARKLSRKDIALAAAAERLNDPHTDPNHDIPEDLRAFADFTLRELVMRFGTDTAFLDWLKATKAIEDVHEKRLKNAEKEGTLISRDLVKRSIIDTVDSAHRKMMTDGAKTISVRIVAMVNAGSGKQEVEDLVAEQIGSFIRPAKAKMERVLRNAK